MTKPFARFASVAFYRNEYNGGEYAWVKAVRRDLAGARQAARQFRATHILALNAPATSGATFSADVARRLIVEECERSNGPRR